jgi:hypothetical protein
MAKRWTEEEDQLILKLREEGFTSREMALRLKGRSDSAIRMRLSLIATDKMNRTWTDEEKELAQQLRKEGHTVKHIAYKLGRTSNAVSSYFYKLDKSPTIPGKNSA